MLNIRKLAIGRVVCGCNPLAAQLSNLKLNPCLAKRDYRRFNPFHWQYESLLLGTKCVLYHQDLQMFSLKLNEYEYFLPT